MDLFWREYPIRDPAWDCRAFCVAFGGEVAAEVVPQVLGNIRVAPVVGDVGTRHRVELVGRGGVPGRCGVFLM